MNKSTEVTTHWRAFIPDRRFHPMISTGLISSVITISVQLGNGIFHGPLWKNVALFGGLLFFIINNPKIYSIYNK